MTILVYTCYSSAIISSLPFNLKSVLVWILNCNLFIYLYMPNYKANLISETLKSKLSICLAITVSLVFFLPHSMISLHDNNSSAVKILQVIKTVPHRGAGFEAGIMDKVGTGHSALHHCWALHQGEKGTGDLSLALSKTRQIAQDLKE